MNFHTVMSQIFNCSFKKVAEKQACQLDVHSEEKSSFVLFYIIVEICREAWLLLIYSKDVVFSFAYFKP